MELRKEQVLAVLTVAIAAWVWNGRRQPLVMSSTVAMKKLEYTAGTVRVAPLAGPVGEAPRRLDFATEPSETQPLPPRALAFPERAPISIVMLPLDLGPDYRHSLDLAGPGAIAEGVTLQAPPEVESTVAAEVGEEVAPGTRAEREAIAARSYDRVYQQNLASPLFGNVEADGIDRYDLEAMTNFDGVTIRLRRYNVDTGKIGRVEVFRSDDRNKVANVVLADNLRNEIVRRTRAVPDDAAHLPDRGKLIQWLLDRAREDSSVYKEALVQADQYLQISGGDIEGLRWQQRVLRAKGDLAAEFALLNGIQGEHRETAFRYEGLGRLKARLGLHEDAEQDLRRAVELAPSDARPHSALAEFLRTHGRSHEAVQAAKRAQETFGILLDAGDKSRVAREILACHLAVSAIDAAKDALRLAGGVPAPYLDAVIKYAAGDVAAALDTFRLVSGVDSGSAQLGQGACLARLGQWQEAHDVLLRVADQEPLLRHRAATGLALVFARVGQFDNALAWLDRAQEANPIDPYQYYLRGVVLRRQGNLDGAQEALHECLRLRDDFVHALVEMSAVQKERALEAGTGAVQAALAAMRHGERAVQLAPRPTVELFELEGLLRFLSADGRGAAASFARARDLASDEQGRLFAKGAIAVVDYSRGAREDAENALNRMAQDLAKDDPMRVWAERTVAAIDDHGQKEMLGDQFERQEPGGIWDPNRDGKLGPAIQNGELVFDGDFARTGEVWVRRVKAVPHAKNFLSTSCKLRVGGKQPRNDGFQGLRISMQTGGGREFQLRAQLGIYEGRPFLLLEENREEPVRQALEVGAVDLSKWQEIELRVAPMDDEGRRFALEARWNGALVYSKELKTLGNNTSTELDIALFATGRAPSPVQVYFDDYRLERRRER